MVLNLQKIEVILSHSRNPYAAKRDYRRFQSGLFGTTFNPLTAGAAHIQVFIFY